VSTDGYLVLQDAVRRRLGLELAHYKREQMERRLKAYAVQRGYGDLAGLAQALGSESALGGELISYLTIHVSEFFRDPNFFSHLQELLGALPPRAGKPLQAWSAGCSIGAEAYSLAMLLSEERGAAGARILATDIDEKSLERARNGVYREDELKKVDPDRFRRYFSQEGQEFRVREDLRRLITFRRHDLLRDPYPMDQDIILFRNVAIYFTEEAKVQVLSGLARALAPHGLLMVGATEAILRPAELGLCQVRPFFFARA
jgi:chemotaxis protein methyltransferase CheR